MCSFMVVSMPFGVSKVKALLFLFWFIFFFFLKFYYFRMDASVFHLKSGHNGMPSHFLTSTPSEHIPIATADLWDCWDGKLSRLVSANLMCFKFSLFIEYLGTFSESAVCFLIKFCRVLTWEDLHPFFHCQVPNFQPKKITGWKYLCCSWAKPPIRYIPSRYQHPIVAISPMDRHQEDATYPLNELWHSISSAAYLVLLCTAQLFWVCCVVSH